MIQTQAARRGIVGFKGSVLGPDLSRIAWRFLHIGSNLNPRTISLTVFVVFDKSCCFLPLNGGIALLEINKSDQDVRDLRHS